MKNRFLLFLFKISKIKNTLLINRLLCFCIITPLLQRFHIILTIINRERIFHLLLPNFNLITIINIFK
jgi:hypothetical protein